MPAEKKLFKDWFDKTAAKTLAAQVAAVHKKFNQKEFIRLCTHKLNTLEFNARVGQFASAYRKTLPDSYPEAVLILQRSLPELLPDTEAVTDGYLQWPMGQFIADHGIDHFDESMRAMVELTQRFSAEFAIRPFVQHRADETFAFLYQQLTHKSPHVRRWCSEGSRTRLPWGVKIQHLIEDPAPVVPVLEALRDDPSLYVRKSVANNLNDLSKDHPALVLKLCREWSVSSNEHRDWIIRHGLRSLVKAGNARALKILGYSKPTSIGAELSLSRKRIAIGESIAISATINNNGKRKQNLLVDYIVYYQGKNDGKRQKVFKWKTLELKAAQEIVLIRKHAMKLTTIRALYPGKHAVELQINGEVVAASTFVLTS